MRSPSTIPAFRATRHPNFRWFLVSSFGDGMGMGMMQLTLAWLVLELTGSLSQLGLAVFLQGLPMIAVVLFGGVLADRLERRKVMWVGQSVMTVNLLALAALQTLGVVEVWNVYMVSVFTGLVMGLTLPARMSYIRLLVDREVIVNAVALNQMLMNSSRIIGPSLAGGLIAASGIGPALYATASMYVIAIGGLLFLRRVPPTERGAPRSPMGDLADGIRYIKRTPLIMAIFLLSLVFGFFGMPYVPLTPGFAREVLNLGPGQAGLLLMTAGIGALVGAVTLASLREVHRKNVVLLSLVFTFCAALLAFAATPWLPLAIVLMLVIGLSSTTFISMINVSIQLTVPQEYLGRMQSMILLGASLMFVGALPMGLVGDALGLRWAFGFGAVVVALATVLIGLVWWPIRKATY